MTHTYAKLEVSTLTFQEISILLRKAGYDHAFHEDQEHGVVIDMHGIGLVQKQPPRCKHCRHWDRRGASSLDPYGFCKRIVDASGDGAQLRTAHGDLATEPDFGCALFEAR